MSSLSPISSSNPQIAAFQASAAFGSSSQKTAAFVSNSEQLLFYIDENKTSEIKELLSNKSFQITNQEVNDLAGRALESRDPISVIKTILVTRPDYLEILNKELVISILFKAIESNESKLFKKIFKHNHFEKDTMDKLLEAALKKSIKISLKIFTSYEIDKQSYLELLIEQIKNNNIDSFKFLLAKKPFRLDVFDLNAIIREINKHERDEFLRYFMNGR